MKVLGLCLLLIAAGVVLVLLVRWFLARRLERARRVTPWSVFSHPGPDGDLVVGIERAWRGRVFQQLTTSASLSPDAEEWDVEIARDRARILADRYNQERDR